MTIGFGGGNEDFIMTIVGGIIMKEVCVVCDVYITGCKTATGL